MSFRTFAAVTTLGLMLGAGAPAALAQSPGPSTVAAYFDRDAGNSSFRRYETPFVP